jgi:hypothetical protein
MMKIGSVGNANAHYGLSQTESQFAEKTFLRPGLRFVTSYGLAAAVGFTSLHAGHDTLMR